MDRITKIPSIYDLLKYKSNFKTKLFVGTFPKKFSISFHDFFICLFQKQLIVQYVLIYRVYFFMFECLGEYYSNKYSE